MLRRTKFWKVAVGILVVVAFFVICGAVNDYFWKAADSFMPPYTPVEEGARAVKITAKANVRKDPMMKEDHDFFYYTNSFGMIKEENFTVEVSKVIRVKQPLDNNGEYIGLVVDEVLATKEGKEWFPESIKDDPDGIVWVNYKYLTVIV